MVSKSTGFFFFHFRARDRPDPRSTSCSIWQGWRIQEDERRCATPEAHQSLVWYRKGEAIRHEVLMSVWNLEENWSAVNESISQTAWFSFSGQELSQVPRRQGQDEKPTPHSAQRSAHPLQPRQRHLPRFPKHPRHHPPERQQTKPSEDRSWWPSRSFLHLDRVSFQTTRCSVWHVEEGIDRKIWLQVSKHRQGLKKNNPGVIEMSEFHVMRNFAFRRNSASCSAEDSITFLS